MPTVNLEKTSNYYEKILNFKAVKYLQVIHTHVCLYRDDVEIILIQSRLRKIHLNRILHGTGYDGYFTTKDVESFYKEMITKKAKIIKHLNQTDYGNFEFIIEDIDERWIAIGLKV